MSVFEHLIEIVAPHACLVCGREGGLLCTWCAPDAVPSLPSRCYKCNAQTMDFAICDRCRHNSSLKHVWIRTNFDGLARQLIHKYKFVHARAAAPEIASLMAQVLPYLPDVLIVPVPTATRRIRQRGFDHTDSLKQALSRQLKLDSKKLLKRLDQHQQVGTKRAERLKQIEGAFWVNSSVTGQKILLVDDVTTTGATLEEAARMLKRAGAKQVDAVVFAQAK